MTTATMHHVRVLVVDDEPIARAGLERLLRDEDFEVCLAAEGRTALEMAARERPDVVITDLRMPDMDGNELCSRIHAIHQDVPVIVVTGFADVSSAVDAIRAGAEDYLMKPLDFDAVLSSLRRAIERRAEKIEREQLRQQAQTLCRDALATSESYREVLSIVSHDLRNPLSVLHYRVAELSRVTLPSDAHEEVLRIAASLGRVTEQMRCLVDDLLAATATSMGAIRLECTDHDARDVLLDTSELRPLALQKQIGLRVRAPSDICVVHGDRQRLGQALNNLLANAIKFGRTGTEIDLSLERVHGGVQFAVRDEGPGIDDEDVARIFDRFWQGKGRQRGGFGLGLFIAKQVVDAHRGRIWVDSVSGVGSTFYVFIPASSGAVDGAASQRGRLDSSLVRPLSART